MNEFSKKTAHFLAKHNEILAPTNGLGVLDVKAAMDNFISKATLGLQKKGQTIPMIPTYLCNVDRSKIKSGKRILIDAGGTNFRVATGYFDREGTAHLEDIQKSNMPASGGEVLSRQEFYDAMARRVAPLADKATDVGFCFSYPVNMGSDMDGEVTNFSKEVKAPEVVGTRVGAETLAALKKYHPAERKIVILNDTVATLLGGMACSSKRYSTYLGYIYGTGTNVCCICNTDAITKVENLPQGKMLVNMECGGFDGFTLGDFDKIAIAKTDNPHSQLFEKMTSGKYLSEIMYETLLGAQKEGLFAGKTEIAPFVLKDVSLLLSENGGCLKQMFSAEDDVQLAKAICDALISRAAAMGALVNAATAVMTATDKSLPVAIVAEGTTFHKLVGYRNYFQNYVKQILDEHGLQFEIVQGEDLNLVGTLMATMVL